MTLSPVFLSSESLDFLSKKGYAKLLEPSVHDLIQARSSIERIMREHYDPSLLGEPLTLDPLKVLQQDFFLVLFQAINQNGNAQHQSLYAQLNYCIRGRITALDNLLDNEQKTTLPMNDSLTGKVRSIAELEAYQLLVALITREVGRETYHQIVSSMYQQSLEIGKVEGHGPSELQDMPKPEIMIQQVHRFRGGKLFRLGMIAPILLESGDYWKKAADALDDIGTAFQIIDDLIDFREDIYRRSQNILVSEIMHHGTIQEKRLLQQLQEYPSENPGIGKGPFQRSLERSLTHAYLIAYQGFGTLQNFGFWYNPQDTYPFLKAITGTKEPVLPELG